MLEKKSASASAAPEPATASPATSITSALITTPPLFPMAPSLPIGTPHPTVFGPAPATGEIASRIGKSAMAVSTAS